MDADARRRAEELALQMRHDNGTDVSGRDVDLIADALAQAVRERDTLKRHFAECHTAHAQAEEEIVRLEGLVKLDAGTIRLREEEIARLRAALEFIGKAYAIEEDEEESAVVRTVYLKALRREPTPDAQ